MINTNSKAITTGTDMVTIYIMLPNNKGIGVNIKAITGFQIPIKANKRVIMTATPFINNVSDLIPIINFIYGKFKCGSKIDFPESPDKCIEDTKLTNIETKFAKMTAKSKKQTLLPDFDDLWLREQILKGKIKIKKWKAENL